MISHDAVVQNWATFIDRIVADEDPVRSGRALAALISECDSEKERLRQLRNVKITAMFKAGMPRVRIQKIMGLSKSQVNDILRDAGVCPERRTA